MTHKIKWQRNSSIGIFWPIKHPVYWAGSLANRHLLWMGSACAVLLSLFFGFPWVALIIVERLVADPFFPKGGAGHPGALCESLPQQCWFPFADSAGTGGELKLLLFSRCLSQHWYLVTKPLATPDLPVDFETASWVITFGARAYSIHLFLSSFILSSFLFNFTLIC